MSDAKRPDKAEHTDKTVRVFTTHSSDETILLGRELAKLLVPPKVLVLR